MRRTVLALIGLYVLAAVATTAAEVAGVGRAVRLASRLLVQQRPGLRLFRWVAPVGHRFADPAEKAARAWTGAGMVIRTRSDDPGCL